MQNVQKCTKPQPLKIHKWPHRIPVPSICIFAGGISAQDCFLAGSSKFLEICCHWGLAKLEWNNCLKLEGQVLTLLLTLNVTPSAMTALSPVTSSHRHRKCTNNGQLSTFPSDSLFWTSQQRAERLRENPGCTADSLPWLALDNPLNLPLALPSWYAPSPTHPFPPPSPRPTGPWGYHLWIHLCPHSPARLSHRILHTQTVNDNSVRAFHIPYTQFPPPTIPTCDVTHSLLPLLPQSLHNHPPQSWMARIQLFCLLLLSVLLYFSLESVLDVSFGAVLWTWP